MRSSTEPADEVKSVNNRSLAHNVAETQEDPCSAASAHQSPSQSLQPPPLKFQRNSSKRAVASNAGVATAKASSSLASVTTAKTSSSVADDENNHCLECLEQLVNIPHNDYRTVSELIDDVLLLTNFN